MPIAQGQLTIVDYNDALSLSAYISSDKELTQVFNPDNKTYFPSLSTGSPMTLTPSLFISGQAGDMITNATSIKWYDGSSTTEIVNGGSYSLAAFASGQNRPLKITANILSGSTYSKTFRCDIGYTDPVTGLALKAQATIVVSRINNGGNITIANAKTPKGNVLKNKSGNVTIVAELLRGSALDSTGVSYQWYRGNDAATTDEGAGPGWNKLSSTYTGGTTGYTSNTLSITPGDVLNIAQFLCQIKDTDTNSPTYNQIFECTATIVDQTDPTQVIINSTGGNIFKNGQGSTVLEAKLYQSGVEVDVKKTDATPQKYTYTWTKRDKNGDLDVSFSKTGKTITVGSADVSAKATFEVNIS